MLSVNGSCSQTREVAMRRALLLFLLMIFLPATVSAQLQIGKRVTMRAGTPEDRALTEINNATDAAKKLQLLDKFLAEFGQGDLAIAAYEIYMTHYAAEKNYDKAFEYGEKILQVDPDSFGAASTLLRLAQEKGDTAKMFDYGDKVGEILQRFMAAPAREGTSAEEWRQQKIDTVATLADQINYVQYTLFNTAYQAPDPAQRAVLLERYVKCFPDSQYTSTAQSLVAASYRQSQNYPKMLEFANGILVRDPNNVGMMLLLADYWSEKAEELDKAEGYAKKSLDLLAKAEKPAQVTEEQWTQQKSVQQGLAQAALGQIYVNQNKLPLAVEAFKAAAQFVKSDPGSYACNLYRLGFTYARMKNNVEARKALTEAAAIEGPCKEMAQDTLTKVGAGPAKKRR